MADETMKYTGEQIEEMVDAYASGTLIPEGGTTVEGAVRYDIAQTLSDTQKAQAIANIGAQEKLTFDEAPTEGSSNSITSGAVNAADMESLSASLALSLPGALRWDGDMEGRYKVLTSTSGNMSIYLVHVSDYVPPVLDYTVDSGITQCAVCMNSWGSIEAEYLPFTYKDDGFVNAELAVVIPQDNYTEEGITFAKKGVYFMVCGGEVTNGIFLKLIYAKSLYFQFIEFPSDSGIPLEDVVVNSGDLTFDGNIAGKEVVDIDNGYYLVKVSDDYIDSASLIGKSVWIYINGEEQNIPITEDLINVQPEVDGYTVSEFIFAIQSEHQYEGGIYLSRGMWFLYMPSENSWCSAVYGVGSTIVEKKIPNKYINAEWMAVSGVSPLPYAGNYMDYEYYGGDVGNDGQNVSSLFYIRISKDVIDPNLFIGESYTTFIDGVESEPKEITHYNENSNGIYTLLDEDGNGGAFIVPNPNGVDGMYLPQGFYIFHIQTIDTTNGSQLQLMYTKDITGNHFGSGTVPLPDKFIPSNVPVISSASVGQFITVAAVDADGKPTSYEAVTIGNAEGVGF